METVGSYEAKTHLPRLLKKVADGEEVIITKNGVPIAKLVPVVSERKTDMKQLIAEMKEFGKGRSLGGLSIREMIEEGRRF